MEELIEEVRNHPCLYDTTLEEYRDAQKKDIIWAEIAKNLNRDYNSIRQDWKRLRDCFRQALARRKTSGRGAKNWKPWRYEKQMQFLTPLMTSRSTSSNIIPVQKESDNDSDSTTTITGDAQDEMEVFVVSKDGGNCKKRKSTSTCDIDKVITYLQEKQQMSNKPDDLDLFFASACQSTKKLPRRLQNKIKRELLDCIMRAEDENEYEMSCSTYNSSPSCSPCSATCD